MSLGARATKGGAKGGKDKQQDKTKATDKQTPKEKVKPQATTEQLRMANMIDRKSDDMCDVRRMVTELMEMTRRTEEEVCSALHDSDNDMVAACNLLLEETQRIQGEWQTREKKKKKPPQPAGNGELEPARDRDPRERSGPRPRRGEGEGARGRGGARGGRGAGRGGRGGARGGRRGGVRPRPARTDGEWNDPDHSNSNNIGDSFPATEDWDNEEWSGSLSDTKVFTPSTAVPSAETPAAPQVPVTEEWDEPATNGPAAGEHIPTYTYHNPQHNALPHGVREQLGSTTPNHTTAAGAPDLPAAPYRAHPPHHHQPMGMSGSLSAAQSQYLSQLTQQTQRHDANVYTTNYGVYGAADMSSQQRKTQRARVPPPSKIPSSAVEMPGDSGGGMFLDVQFGALEPDTLHSPPPPHQSPHQTHSAPHQPPLQPHSAPHQAPLQSHSAPHQAPLQQHSAPHQAPLQPHSAPHQAHSAPHQAPHPTHQAQVSHAPVTTTAAPAQSAPTPQPTKQVTSPPEPQPVSAALEAPSEPPPSTYPSANTMLSESMSVVESTPTSQPATTESAVTNSTSLDKLSASMKQLVVSAAGGVSAVSAVSAGAPVAASEPAPAPHQAHHYAHHRAKGAATSQSVYAAHHAVTHHPPVYGANLYAPQVNSTNASLTGASAMTATAYPSSVTLTQYQPMINSYQQTSSSAGVYAGNALYTAAAAPYAPYQQPQPAKQTKDTTQYDSSVASSNSLTSTSTTQTSTSKVTTTTVTGGGNAGNAGVAGVAGNAGAGGAAGGYAGGALYGGAYAYDETQIMRHHMGGYYEVGYSGRDGAFGLGAGERFGRTDAASPQQVPTALPPGYAYFYQPPPTTYQYGVYPTYGGGGNVTGVTGVTGVGGVGVSGGGKVSAYSQQQPPYDAQDSYKPGGGYNASASKAGGAAAELGSNMYAKTHVALNKVNSYEKAAFHSGTPPPFGAGSHLYIPAPPPIHHQHHHAPQQHQMDVRVNSSHNRRESGAGGGRAAASKPAASKPGYSQSYWTPN